MELLLRRQWRRIRHIRHIEVGQHAQHPLRLLLVQLLHRNLFPRGRDTHLAGRAAHGKHNRLGLKALASLQRALHHLRGKAAGAYRELESPCRLTRKIEPPIAVGESALFGRAFRPGVVRSEAQRNLRPLVNRPILVDNDAMNAAQPGRIGRLLRARSLRLWSLQQAGIGRCSNSRSNGVLAPLLRPCTRRQQDQRQKKTKPPQPRCTVPQAV